MASIKRLQANYGGINYKAYEPYRVMRRKIARMKTVLAKEILELVTPYMWETGYCKNSFDFNEKPRIMLKGYFFEFSNKRKEERKDYYKIGGLNIIGFTENGVAYDAYGGGLSSGLLTDICIEDLFKLHVWLLNRKEFQSNKKVNGQTNK